MPYKLSEVREKLVLGEENNLYYNSGVRIEGMCNLVCPFCLNHLIPVILKVRYKRYRCVCGRLLKMEHGKLVAYDCNPKMEYDTRLAVLARIADREFRGGDWT